MESTGVFGIALCELLESRGFAVRLVDPPDIGGKVLSRRTTPCANRGASALRLAASALHGRPSAWGAFGR
jgi:hypothetical protein